jgi:hypothetical protein
MSQDDDDLLERLRDLPREIEPAADLWPAIEARIDAKKRRASPVRILHHTGLVTLAAAAAVLLCVTTARRYLGHETPRTAMKLPALATSSTHANLLPEEPAYRDALEELRGELAASAEGLPPDAVHDVSDNLRVIEASIAATRAELAKNPRDAALQTELRDEYQQAIDVLSDVVDLATRT